MNNKFTEPTAELMQFLCEGLVGDTDDSNMGPGTSSYTTPDNDPDGL
ncbi:MAG: hypothetical protein IKK55_02170 [Clostridia bacterium]|nr:hypothetical protein [Clostridia bacterium]